MDGGNRWNFKIGQAIENLLPALNKSTHLAGLRSLQQRLQIRTRDENGFLCRRNDQAAQRSIFLHGIEVFIQVIESSSIENVRARVGAIESEHANVIVTGLAPIIGAVATAGISLILERFRQMPSMEDQS